MKTIAIVLNNPIMVLLSSLLGASAILYLQNTAVQAIYWFIPCLALIVADLAAGIKAARFRGEQVRFSGALRRTGNKCLCYVSWIICCVALNERYGTQLCAWCGMGLVFFIEGLSFFSNIIEPHGLKLSIKGILKVAGQRHNINGLEQVVEKTDENGKS